MLLIKNHKFALTLVTYVLLALTLVEATSHSIGGVSRRDHGNLKRFVKKRSPFPQTSQTPTDTNQNHSKNQNLGSDDSILNDIPVVGAAGDPATASAASSSTIASTSASISASQSASISASTSASASSSASTSSSSSSSSSQSTSSTSTTSDTTTTLATETAAPTRSTVTLLSTASLPSTTPTNSDISGAATQTKHTALTAVIVVAACVGGIVILWTIFRKWKLGRSKEFDQRLQPIDWQPTSHDDGIVPAHRRHSGASSVRRNYGASEVSPTEYRSGSLQPIPDHDFTAGSNLAPVGGYADLSRGPSPQPQMMERGPTMGSGYDAGLPLHHQGYGSQDAYNGVRY